MELIYRVFAFVAPAIWRTLITSPLNCLLATLPQSLILRSILSTATPPCTPSDAFDQRTFVVVRDGTTPTIVLDLDVLLMASYTMELRRWVQIHEEICDGRERRVGQVMFRSGRSGRIGRRPEFGERVLVEGLGGDGSD